MTPRTQREFSSLFCMADSFFLRLVDNVTCLFQCPLLDLCEFEDAGCLAGGTVVSDGHAPLRGGGASSWVEGPSHLAEAFTAVQDTGDQ